MREIREAVSGYMQQYHMTMPGDTVIVGVSGGADSVCLLLILADLREEFRIRLEAVHVHHGLRPEAEAEADSVVRLCEGLKIPCTVVREQVDEVARREKISCEEAGRLVRYRAFERRAAALESGAGTDEAACSGGIRTGGGTEVCPVRTRIAVAHHKNDRAETVLFHLLRGTGLAGLAGIRPVRDHIIRPLLCLSREEIEAYLRKRGISWCMDGSNLEETYTRNKIRLRLLPYAEREICRESVEHIVKAAEAAAEAEDYLEGAARKAYRECLAAAAEAECRETGAACAFCIEKLLLEHPVIQKRILLQALQRMGGGKDIGSVHLNGLLGLFHAQGSKSLCLPHGICAKKEYDTLLFVKNTDRTGVNGQEGSAGTDAEYPAAVPGQVELGDGRILYFESFPYEKSQIIPQKSCTKWFDYDKIKKSMIVRTRRSGDYLTIDSSLSRQTLKKYMIQEKIPRERRERMYVLAEGAHIIWVIGYRISQYYKVDEQTKNILQVRLEERKEEHGGKDQGIII